jgi:hypothetical protein
MTKRARGVRVHLDPGPTVGVGLTGMLRRPVLTETNAHEVNEQTPCAVCGGPCPTGSVHWGPWRVHDRCQALRGDPASRLQAAAKALGRHLERADALLVGFSARPYAEDHPEPTWTDERLRERLPWRHVDRQGLYAALEQVPLLRVEAGLVDAPCSDGACAWCGVLEGRGWSSFGHTWADGTSAPLCGPCGQVYERTGEPSPAYWPEQRAGIAEAATGVPVGLGESAPDGLLAFAEVEGNGDGTPWSHLPAEALSAYRWTAWAHWGGKYAPPEHRAEALARARAHDAAKAARHAAILAEERARLDTYGFGVA